MRLSDMGFTFLIWIGGLALGLLIGISICT